MNKKILDLIIIISVIGIIGSLIIQTVFKSPLKSNIAIQPVIGPTTVVRSTLDDKINCQHAFFPYQPGTNWQYNLQLNSENINFDLSIDKVTGSLIIINTAIPKTNKTAKTTLICRRSGIYGLPFSVDLLAGQLLKNQDMIKMGSELLTNLRTIPAESFLQSGKIWTDKISIIPGYLDFNINSRVINQKTIMLFDQQRKIISIESTLLTDSSGSQIIPSVKNNKLKLLSYQLAEGIGLINLNVNFNDTKIKLTLLNFSSPVSPINIQR